YNIFIHEVDGQQRFYRAFRYGLKLNSIKGWAFFLAIKLGMGWKPYPKESIMDFLNTFIAVIAVLITLFREEIRKILFKSKK
ncbi:hypothetical protein ACS14X_002005, partial [Campylobacter jejuni]